MTLASLRAQIGLVTQDVVLFDESVRRNVAYGTPDVPEARIREALAAANALAFVDALPEGLDTRVGEGGARLSGGQRQRLAIARALLKDPPILVLDEATSALDAESERAVQEALERLMAGRTTLVTPQALRVRRADQLAVVIEDGRIVERGSHGDLLAAGGLYRRLTTCRSSDNGARRGEALFMKSMTGFSKAAGAPDGTEVSVVVKGVNHRFLDLGSSCATSTRRRAAIRRAVGRSRSEGAHRHPRSDDGRARGLKRTTMEAAGEYAREWREDSLKRGLPADLSAGPAQLPGVVGADDAGAAPDSTFEESSSPRRTGAAGFRRRAGTRRRRSLSYLQRNPWGELTKVAALDAERVGIPTAFRRVSASASRSWPRESRSTREGSRRKSPSSRTVRTSRRRSTG